ncbi:MAG: hypothetical protein K1X29_08365 [Bdellovibrionales bacterium]|nr:hypothetical protein [Bdellovibrionales bacterium]
MVIDNQGQAVTEAVLILVIFLLVGTLVSNQFKQNQLINEIVSSPWQRVSGMLQNGVWMSPSSGAPFHPSQHGRHISSRGEELK